MNSLNEIKIKNKNIYKISTKTKRQDRLMLLSKGLGEHMDLTVVCPYLYSLKVGQEIKKSGIILKKKQINIQNILSLSVV